MIQPYKEHLVVIPDPTHSMENTKEGLYVIQHYQKRDGVQVHLQWGTVDAVGPTDEKRYKPGVKIAFNPFDAHEMVDGSRTVLIVPTAGVRAIVV